MRYGPNDRFWVVIDPTADGSVVFSAQLTPR